MELTKEQIQKIDKRLQINGMKYWDIRLETLDHIVTDIENRLQMGESYKSALKNAFYALGLHGNLEHLTQYRLITINKIVRKQYFNNLKQLLTEPFSLMCVILFLSIYFLVFSFASIFFFKIITFTFLLTPIVVGFILFFLESLKKEKSGYLLYGSFYIFFSFLMLNIFIQFVKPEGIIPVSKEIQQWVWFLVTCINSVFSFAGIISYLKIIKKLRVN